MAQVDREHMQARLARAAEVYSFARSFSPYSLEELQAIALLKLIAANTITREQTHVISRVEKPIPGSTFSEGLAVYGFLTDIGEFTREANNRAPEMMAQAREEFPLFERYLSNIIASRHAPDHQFQYDQPTALYYHLSLASSGKGSRWVRRRTEKKHPHLSGIVLQEAVFPEDAARLVVQRVCEAAESVDDLREFTGHIDQVALAAAHEATNRRRAHVVDLGNVRYG